MTDTLRQHAARYVAQVVAACGGNKKLACRQLDITWATLTRYLELHRQLSQAKAVLRVAEAREKTA